MNRRDMVVASLAVGCMPISAWTQQPGKVWRIGFLAVRQEPALLGAFATGMKDLGYVEGKNLQIEARSAEGKTERLAGLADELVRLNVDAVVTAGTLATAAIQKATSTVPIVMGASADPVGNGFVRSLADPAGNITGMSTLRTDTSAKLLEMLRGVVTGLTSAAIMWNPTNTAQPFSNASIRSAAQRMRVTIMPVQARSEDEIDAAFSTMAQAKVGAVIVMRDGVFLRRTQQIAELATRHRLPTISDNREYVDAGTLMSYGPSLVAQFAYAATYVGKIFKGARPGDLPVEQPTTFELVVNLKTAKALGITIPQSMLLRADEVIQ